MTYVNTDLPVAPNCVGSVAKRDADMNYSIATADQATYLKIIFVALFMTAIIAAMLIRWL